MRQNGGNFARTDDHLLGVNALQCRVRLGNDEHVSNALARSFLAECHLQDGGIYGLSRDLTPEFVELPVRDFEICRRVLVLCAKRVVSKCVRILKVTRAYMVALFGRALLSFCFLFLWNDGIKYALAVVLCFGSFRGIYFTIRPLLSYTWTHRSPKPFEWVCAK
jgi:hypothetical protein